MTTPRICFLGLCQNATQLTTEFGMPIGINILGLTSHVISAIFPFTLGGMGMVLSVFNPQTTEKVILVFRNLETKDFFDITLEMTSQAQGDPDPLKLGLGWFTVVGKAPENSLVINPGQFSILLKNADGSEEFIGYLTFHHFVPPPLTEASIEAIKADPMALKAVRFSLKCNKCEGQLRTYSALARNPALETQGWIWQTELPEIFICPCAATTVPLKYLKLGLHGLLKRGATPAYTLTSMTALYEGSALEQYCREFRQLLDKKPEKEETLQSFLNDHKIFLHRFAATQIRTKPPILSKFNADFIILNNRKELLLVEIEKSTLKLLKKTKNSYGVTADLQHAIDQVRSWRQVFDDFRDAALANIDLDKKDVAKIKGVVIAGRTPVDEAEARYLRALNLDVELFTYDDLISDVVESIRHINVS